MTTRNAANTSPPLGAAAIHWITIPLLILVLHLISGCDGQPITAAESSESIHDAGLPDTEPAGNGFVEPGPETLEVNFADLARIEPYAGRGGRGGNGSVPKQPLPKEIGAEELDAIAATRGFHKVFGQLRALPSERAAVLLSAEIEATLQAYREQYEHAVNRLRMNKETMGELPPGTPISAGLSRQISDNKDGTPTMHGLRYKLLGLVWCAGALELDGTDNAVQDVAKYALEQRAQCYEDDAVLSHADRMLILMMSSLYNRQILATALLAVSLDAGPSNLVETGLDIPWKPYPLSVSASIKIDQYYNKSASELRETRPLAPSDAVSTVDAISDDEFDSIVARVGLANNP